MNPTLTVIPLPDDGTVDTQVFVFSVSDYSGLLDRLRIGLKSRYIRTDYPGSDGRPTFQALGWNWEPIEYNVILDDRFLGDGVALGTWRRFAALVKAGDPVRVTFQEIGFNGFLSGCTADYVRADRIGLRFNLDPFDETTGGVPRKKSPLRTLFPQIRIPSDYQARISASIDLSVQYSLGFSVAVSIDAQASISASLTALVSASDATAATIDLRSDAGAVRRFAASCSDTQVRASEVLIATADLSSDDTLVWSDPINELAFESSVRGVSYQARVTMLQAYEASQALGELVDGSVLGLYQASAGESLYAIARDWYGQPLEWRRIAARNQIRSINLVGGEILVIPSITAGG